MKNELSKAQGTIEYLVIIAIVVVLSLGVVGMLAGNTNEVTNISSNTKDLSSQSSQISVSDVVVDARGDGIITLANNSGGNLSVTKISVDGVDTNYSNIFLNVDKRSFTIRDVGAECSCVGFEGTKKTCEVSVFVLTQEGLTKEYKSDLVVECVDDAIGKDDIIPVKFNDECTTNAPLMVKGAVRDSNWNDYLSSVVLDDEGNIYITGYFASAVLTLSNDINIVNSGGGYSFFVAKYNSSGTVQWARGAEVGGGLYAGSKSISLDSNNNIIIAGAFNTATMSFSSDVNLTRRGATGSDFFIAKYTNDGVVQWAKNPAVGTLAGDDFARDVKVDLSGNIFVAGSYSSNISFSSDLNLPLRGAIDFFLAKYDSNGTPIWAKGNNTGSSYDYANSVAVDQSGNIFVVGNFASPTMDLGNGNTLTSSGNYDFFVVKYNSSGVAQWAKNPLVGASYDFGYATSVDSSGNVFVGGSFNSALLGFSPGVNISLPNGAGNGFFVAKYDGTGTVLWARGAYSGTGGGNDLVNSLFVNNTNDVFVAGMFSSAILGFSSDINVVNTTRRGLGNSGDFFVAKYNSNGIIQWAKDSVGSPYVEEARSVFVNSLGNVFVGGNFTSERMYFGIGFNLENLGSESTDFLDFGEYSQDFFLVKYSGSLEEVCSTGGQDGASCASGKECSSGYCDLTNNICSPSQD
jgi:hypothetical protein